MPFDSEKQRRFLWANKPEVARKLAHAEATGKMIEVEEEELIGKMSGPLKPVGECGKCKSAMIGKHCGCNSKHGKGKVPMKRKLPMIGKADENFDELHPDLQRLISQLPLEMQATQLGGAGSTDIRPTLDEMNYEMPSRHIGRCGTCDHAHRHDGILTCHALNLDPPVSPQGHCDLWTGGRHMTGKARNGAGPTVPYGQQSMPDYEFIYQITPKSDQAKRERKMMDERRRASAERNSGRYGFHGEPPEPVIDNPPGKWPAIEVPKRAEKFQTKPVIQAPVIRTKHSPKANRRLFTLPRTREADAVDVPRKPQVQAVKKSLGSKSPEATDPQDGLNGNEQLQWFPDEESAARYCHGRDGLYPIPVDSVAAKTYGVMMGGWLVCDAETGIFEVVR